MNDVLEIFLLALFAACYPTLLVAVTVMLFLPNPKRLMLGYLLGAYTVGIGLGLVIVYTLQDSGFEHASHRTVSPGQDIAIGVVLLIVATVLRGGYDERLAERRRRRKEEKRDPSEAPEPWAQRMLGRGSARITYAVGVALSFPGVAYLTALNRISSLEAAVAPTVALVVAICVIQQLLLELPLLGYVFAPDRTQDRVQRFRAWLTRNGRRGAMYGAGILGAILIARGVIELL
ncbi:MAG TPA: GAP family protein [Solirubrobacterales bacterium]|nr:GAP family protein [Solirubrobacterales bacterium]